VRLKTFRHEELLREALSGKAGFTVVEYPKYRLKVSPKAVKLPNGKYARTALLALKEASGPLALPDLVHAYNSKYRHAAICPEFWMWQFLDDKKLSRIIAKSGALRLDLTDAMRQELDGKTTVEKMGFSRF